LNVLNSFPVQANLHSDAEATLARLNIGMEEFIPLLIDRIMALIRSMDSKAGANGAGRAAQMEHARDIALASLCEALVSGMSPELRTATLHQLLPDILKNPCRGSGGSTTTGSTVFLSWVGQLVQSNPTASLAYVMPFLISKINAVSARKEDEVHSIVWYNHVLETIVVHADSAALVLYRTTIEGCIQDGGDCQFRGEGTAVLFKSSVSLLKHYIHALVGDRPLSVEPTSNWGRASVHRDLQVDWHTLNGSTRGIVEDLLVLHLDASATRLEELLGKVDKGSTLVREIGVIHVGGTRCVTSSTGNIMKIRARITLAVEFIRGYIFIFLFYV
jgi:hypothetical protein